MDEDKCVNENATAESSVAPFDDVSLLETNGENSGECSLTGKEHRKTHSNASSSSQDDTMYSTGSTPLGTPVSISLESLNKLDEKFDSLAFAKVKNGLALNLKAIEENYERNIGDLQREKHELQNEIETLRSKVLKQEQEFASSVSDLKAQFNSRLEKASKQADSSRKDLESMVVNYAKSEKEAILLKRSKEDTERKLREALKDKEALLVRIKGLSNDKLSLMASLDRKLAETAGLQREAERLKDEFKNVDSKYKQLQLKAHSESELHSATQQKLESLHELLGDLKAENEELRKNLYQRREEAANGATVESSAEVPNEAESVAEVEAITSEKLAEYEKENHQMTVKIQALERERLEHEENVSKLKEALNEALSDVMACNQKINSLEEVRDALERERELGAALQKELQRLKEANNELVSEMEICRHKEGELLEFTERLTTKTVHLQSEHNTLEQKCATLNDEVKRHVKRNTELEEEVEKLQKEGKSCQEKHQNEVSLLARKVAEKAKLIEELRAKVDEVENENKVMKKRHINSVKELNKELLLMKRRLENNENQGQPSNTSETVSIGSRTSSTTSLETCQQTNGNVANTSQPEEVQKSVNHSDSVPQLDKQMLINRILKLQKTLNKRQEKIDFLEEHNQQLLEEMKKKTKLIQYYILREETGALTTNKMDENKKQLTKRGAGVMASLYSSSSSDASMTVGLSLEINKKLQAVLEDTILKNITLKENINTLGDEIARLTNQCNARHSHS